MTVDRPARVAHRLARAVAAVIEPLEQRRLMYAGGLDTSFGSGGYERVVDTAAAGRTVAFSATAAQPDGRVLMVTSDEGATDLTVYRYTAAGDADPTWGTDGVVTLTGALAAMGLEQNPQVIVEPDADVLVAAGGGMVRLSPEGVPDTTFGSAGTGYVSFALPGGLPAIVAGAALQSDGKVVLTINDNQVGNLDAFVQRYTTAGTIDTTFGTGGTTELETSAYVRVQVGGLAIDAGGRIDVGLGVTLDGTAEATVGEPDEFAVERLLTTGFADITFGTDGTAFANPVADQANNTDVAVAAGGTIYEVQTTDALEADSAPYAESFSATGAVNGPLPIGFTAGGLTSVVVQSDGKPIVSGYLLPIEPQTGTNFFAERFDPLTTAGTGTVDTSFGVPTVYDNGTPQQLILGGNGTFIDSLVDGGQTTDTAYALGDRGWSAALEPDGTLFLAGTTIEASVTFDLIKLGSDPTLAASVGTITGNTYGDTNADATQDDGETGLPLYDVFLDNNDDGTFDTGDVQIFTDATGDYSFIGLAPGTYHVYQTLVGGQSHTEPAGSNLYNVTVTGGAVSPGNDFGVAGATPTPTPTPSPTPTATASGEIDGTVFLDNNADGVRQAGEPGLYDWGVYLDNNNDGIFDAGDTRVFTNTAGVYAFTALAPGTYRLRENLPVGYVRTTPASLPITITVANGSITTENFGYQYIGGGGAVTTGGQITGFVFDDSNDDGLLNDGENGLTGIQVYLDNNNDGTYDAGDTAFTTDVDGQYTFNDLTAGTYRVRTTIPAGYTLTTAAFPRVVTVATTTVTQVNIGLLPTGTGYISGTVFLDTNANGVQNAGEPGLDGFGVYLDLNGDGTYDAGDIRVFTNAQGQYTLGDLAPGTYQLRESIPAGYTLTTAAFPRSVVVTAGAGVTVNIGYTFS
jgi:uncharacterized delta-60 repeat protein